MRLVLIAIAAATALSGCKPAPERNESEAAPITKTATPPALSRIDASFDCATARGQAQELICGDNGLAAMDREAARLAAADPAGQAAWSKQRDDCWKSDELRQCVLTSTAVRIHQLRKAAPALEPGDGISVGPVAYRCKGVAGSVEATFINSDPGAVALEWGGQTRALEHVIAADGAKYEGRSEGQSLTFWSKGQAATLTLPGKGDLACEEVPPRS